MEGFVQFSVSPGPERKGVVPQSDLGQAGVNPSEADKRHEARPREIPHAGMHNVHAHPVARNSESLLGPGRRRRLAARPLQSVPAKNLLFFKPILLSSEGGSHVPLKAEASCLIKSVARSPPVIPLLRFGNIRRTGRNL